MKKVLSYFLTITIMLLMMNSIVFAGTPSNQEVAAVGELRPKLAILLNAAAWFGYAISLGMFLYIGAKYTLSAASEKANVKQGLINYFIGAVLIVCASLIADVASGIATGGNGDVAGLAGQIIEVGKEAAGLINDATQN